MIVKQLSIIGLAAVLVHATGCAKTPATAVAPAFSTRYELVRTSWNWIVDVIVNDQPLPATSQAGTTFCDLTGYVIDGKNRVQLKARYVPGISSQAAEPIDKCELAVDCISYRRDGEQITWTRTSLGKAKRMPADGQGIDAVIEFTASVPMRWSWQDADDLGALTEDDKRAVMEKVREIANLLKSRDLRGVYDKSAHWWTGSQRPQVPWVTRSFEARLEDDVTYCREVEPWLVTVADQNSLDFRKGTKILTLSVPRFSLPDTLLDRGCSDFPTVALVVRAGPPPDTPADGKHAIFGMIMGSVQLIKVKGSWQILYWSWAD